MRQCPFAKLIPLPEAKAFHPSESSRSSEAPAESVLHLLLHSGRRLCTYSHMCVSAIVSVCIALLPIGKQAMPLSRPLLFLWDCAAESRQRPLRIVSLEQFRGWSRSARVGRKVLQLIQAYSGATGSLGGLVRF